MRIASARQGQTTPNTPWAKRHLTVQVIPTPSSPELNKRIWEVITGWNECCRPFILTKASTATLKNQLPETSRTGGYVTLNNPDSPAVGKARLCLTHRRPHSPASATRSERVPTKGRCNGRERARSIHSRNVSARSSGPHHDIITTCRPTSCNAS